MQRLLQHVQRVKELEIEDENPLGLVHHKLMSYYGTWIPLKELEELPIPAILELVCRCVEDARNSSGKDSKIYL
jgi:hypothetical protein